MSFRPRRAGVNVQFTEISAEPLVGFHIQRLIAKEQNLMLRQRLMQPSTWAVDRLLVAVSATLAPMRGVTGETSMDS
jgi:hypothetical protein